MPYPEAIQNAPELDFTLGLFYDAFMELSTCRPIGMDQGQIPWTAINDYCRMVDISENQADDMYYYIRMMDEVYLKHYGEKSG